MTDNREPVLNMEEREEIRVRMRALDDRELLRIFAIEQPDYRPEALKSARAEIRKRGLTILSAEQYLEQYSKEETEGGDAESRANSKTGGEPPDDTSKKSDRSTIEVPS